MARITKREEIAKKSLYQIGYKYLCDNFHKFNDDQKIKISIECYKVERAKPLVDQSTHHHITLIAPPERTDELKDRAAAVPV